MDEDRLIAEVAKRNGVLLHRDDPILIINTMLEMHAADQQERDAGIVAALSQIRQPVPAGFTDGQVNDIGHRLLGACHMWSRNLMRPSLAKSWAVMAAVVLGAMLVGGVVSWLAFGQPLDTQCRDERGGRWCGYWLTQPPAK